MSEVTNKIRSIADWMEEGLKIVEGRQAHQAFFELDEEDNLCACAMGCAWLGSGLISVEEARNRATPGNQPGLCEVSRELGIADFSSMNEYSNDYSFNRTTVIECGLRPIKPNVMYTVKAELSETIVNTNDRDMKPVDEIAAGLRCLAEKLEEEETPGD